MRKDGMHRFGPDMSNRSLCLQSVEEKSSLFLKWFCSRAKTEGDRRVVSSLRGVLVFTLHSFQLVL